MKKRILIFISILIVGIMCFAGCTKTVSSSSKYTKLNSLAKLKYSNVVINIDTKSDDETLSSSFTVKNNGEKSEIEYSIESFTEIVFPEVPTDYKTKKVGKITVENGKVTDTEGDEIDVDLSSIPSMSFDFAKDNFADAEFNGNKFTAKVTSPKQFLSNDTLICSDMKIEVSYNSSALNGIVLTYTASNGSEVTVRYIFTL